MTNTTSETTEPLRRRLPDCYVLTVDKPGGERRRSTAEQLDGLPFDWSFVEGHDSRRHTPWELYSPRRNRWAMKRSMSAGEVACYAGHREIWRRVLESGKPCALVLEDDFRFADTAGFLAGVRAGIDHAAHWDMLKLFDFQPKRVIREAEWGGVRFVQYKYPASGMVAYLISRRGCECMLRRERFYRPVDEDLSYPWETGLRVWSVDPNPVIEIAPLLGGSLLEADRHYRRREERRPLRRIYGKWLIVAKKLCAIRYRYEMLSEQGPWRYVPKYPRVFAKPPVAVLENPAEKPKPVRVEEPRHAA